MSSTKQYWYTVTNTGAINLFDALSGLPIEVITIACYADVKIMCSFWCLQWYP
jgi:hypothetical protein